MNRAIAIGVALVLAAAGLWAAWRFLRASPAIDSTPVVEAGNGHAYRFIAAPNIGWDQARAAAAKLTWRGRAGYLATIDSAAEYQFVLDRLFAKTFPDVTYLGGAPDRARRMALGHRPGCQSRWRQGQAVLAGQ